MITIVLGLPRSGTSLVMQMLAAGGYPILCDHHRPPDDDNPRGYLEYAKVNSLERDSSWLDEAEGKAVKIISFLLPKLPQGHNYQVLSLRRDLTEILQTQAVMLQCRGEPPGPSNEGMRTHFEKHLQSVHGWLSEQSHIRLMNCPYAELMRDPREMVSNINRFMGDRLNDAKMAEAVDLTLHRQRYVIAQNNSP